ncbi:MAG: type I-F CRISPR-associated helicase Cas3f, partial [Rhodanobacter sp.]
EDSHVLYEGNEADHPLLSRALANPDISRLISAPMLVCTVDHLAPATESLRAGRQIAPMLRLMSSDLVLDELDDYDLDDLPALTRLMHWAGLLGSRVVLSSATLPPAVVEGMFMAYRAGRGHYRRNRGQRHAVEDAPIEVPCLWADEFGTQVQGCTTDDDFAAAHDRFVERRVSRLQAAVPLRMAELLPVTIDGKQPASSTHAAFAGLLREASLRLHADHAQFDPKSGKRVSFGLVRMANIEPIVEVARALIEGDMPADTRLHLCIYHARFPLLLRSAIEAMLDAAFNRRDAGAVWQQADIRRAIDKHKEKDHLFVVLASPVCEVGRDWDADWALAEPSSMRSLIQLAGRVQRHRRQPPQTPNMLVFDTNLKGIRQGNGHEAVFTRPGFEKAIPGNDQFLLTSHRLTSVLTEAEYRHLNAVPRIQPRADDTLRPRERWVDLEHARLRAGMLPASAELASASGRRGSRPKPQLPRDYAAACWQHPQAALSGVLPQQQAFREEAQPGTTLAWLPDEDEDDALKLHRVEDLRNGKRGEKLYVPAPELLHDIALKPATGISRWGEFDLLVLVKEQADARDLSLGQAARKFTTVE